MTVVYDPLTYRTLVSRPGEVPYKFWSVNKLVIDAAAAGICVLHSGDAAPDDTSRLWLDLTMPENAVGSVKAYDGASWVALTPQLFYSHIAGYDLTAFAKTMLDDENAPAVRSTIYAASFDAGASLGLLTNPHFEISQENGTTLLSAIGTTPTYAADQWRSSENSSGAASVQNAVDPFSSTSGFRRLKNSVKMIATTAAASYSSAESFNPCVQDIEGHFLKTLGFGTADARAAVAVWIGQVSVAGTYTLTLRNGVPDRSFASNVVLAANTPTVVLVPIAGDTSGTWASDNTRGAILTFGVVAGSSLQASTLDAWAAGNFTSHASSTNWAGTTNAFVQTAYFNLFPAGVLPFTSAAQITGEALQLLLNMRRPYDEELRRCLRYWTKTYNYAVAPGTGTLDGGFDFYVPTGGTGTFRTPVRFPVRMRTTPTVVTYDAVGAAGFVFKGGNGKTATISETGESGCTLGTADATSANELFFHYTANARM